MIDGQKLKELFQIEWEEDQANELSYVVSVLPDNLLPLVVDRSKRFLNWLHRDVVLDRLAPRLDSEVLRRATQNVADFDDTVSLVHALKDLAKYVEQPQRNEVHSYALDQLLAEGNPKWVSDEVLKLRADLDGELREKATASLPEELQNTTYEEVIAQRHAATLKQFEEDPDFKKRFDDMMEAARKKYAPQETDTPEINKLNETEQSNDPSQKLREERLDFLTFLDEARYKKRESVFWLFANIAQMFQEDEPPTQIASAIVRDILDIHKNWHWP